MAEELAAAAALKPMLDRPCGSSRLRIIVSAATPATALGGPCRSSSAPPPSAGSRAASSRQARIPSRKVASADRRRAENQAMIDADFEAGEHPALASELRALAARYLRAAGTSGDDAGQAG